MSDDDQNIGRLISGRYRLDGLLGRGGFGSVYRGWDSQIGRDVAVKLLDVANRARSAQQTAELRERFRREAMAAGRISHPGVVTIYDFGIPDDGSEAYLVMALLEGHDLAKELRDNGPMRPDRVKRLFIPMLEALGRGHDLGIVHKDIKPQNIFLCHPETNSESLCLVDFGVARVVHEDKLTMTGLIVGTPQYMVPEYITDTLVTPALDVYQMALILVELITGVPAVPAGESFVKSCNRHFTGDLNIPEQLKEGEFGRMLELALNPEPAERLANASLFAEMFAEIDPSSIVVDAQSTMVFTRTESEATDAAEPPMFPPMKRDQVSAELERLERGSDTFPHAPHTPHGTLERVAEHVADHVSAPVVAAGGSAPAGAPVVAPPVETAPIEEPPSDAQPPAAPSPFPMWAGAAAITLLLVGGAAAALALATKQKPQPQPPAEPEIVVETMDPEPAPTIVAEVDVAEPEMTLIRSEPPGARIIVNGVDVGSTPGEVELGSSDAAELHLDGFEVALVKIEPDLETIELTELPQPTAKKTNAVRPAVVVGKPFVPEEPDIEPPEEVEEPEVEAAANVEAAPAKFKSTKRNERPERFDKPKVDIAP